MSRRREVMGAGLLCLALRPAKATPESLQAALQAFSGGAALRQGRVLLTIAELVENGNAVPVSVSVASPMSESDHVRRIALFAEHNPQPDVAIFHLGPHNGRAQVAVRMRLATSQTVLAVAEMSDGSFWQHSVDVLVTLAACLEN